MKVLIVAVCVLIPQLALAANPSFSSFNVRDFLTSATSVSIKGFTNQVFYVDPSGSDTNDGSMTRPWKTPGMATATVTGSGCKIVINPGTYYLTTNNLRVYSGVSVFGTRGQSIIIYPGGSPAGSAFGFGISNNTIIDGLNVYTTNSAATDQSQPIIDLAVNPTNEVRFCDLYGPFDALYSQPSGYGKRYWHHNKLGGSFDTAAVTGGEIIFEDNLVVITNLGYSSQTRGMFLGAPGATTAGWVNNNTFIIEDNFASNSVAFGIDVRGGSTLQLGNNQFFIVTTNPTVTTKAVFITGGTVVNRGNLSSSDIGRALTGAQSKLIDAPSGGFSGLTLGLTNIATDYTLRSNVHFVNADTTAGVLTVTLDYTTNFPSFVPRVGSGNGVGGFFCTIKNFGTNALNILVSGADTIDGLAGYTNATQYGTVTVGVTTNGIWGVYGEVKRPYIPINNTPLINAAASVALGVNYTNTTGARATLLVNYQLVAAVGGAAIITFTNLTSTETYTLSTTPTTAIVYNVWELFSYPIGPNEIVKFIDSSTGGASVAIGNSTLRR